MFYETSKSVDSDHQLLYSITLIIKNGNAVISGRVYEISHYRLNLNTQRYFE